MNDEGNNDNSHNPNTLIVGHDESLASSTNIQRLKLEHIRAKYGERIAADQTQKLSAVQEDSKQARRGTADDPDVARHSRTLHGSARQQIEAMLHNPKRVHSSVALELSMHQCEAAADEAAIARGSATIVDFGRHQNVQQNRQHQHNVAALVHTLRERREAAELAAMTAMQELSQILEASHLDEARALQSSFLRQTMLSTSSSPAAVTDANSHVLMPLAHQTLDESEVRGDELPSRSLFEIAVGRSEPPHTARRSTMHDDMSSINAPPTLFLSPPRQGSGSSAATPLTLIATAPHLLQHGLFFASLNAVTHISTTSSPNKDLFLVATSIEELMTFTARQLAMRILYAVWHDIMVPMGHQLSSYESNFSMSQVSTAAVRSTLYRWGAVSAAPAALEPNDFAPERSERRRELFEDSLGFNRVAELYDSGLLQVVVSHSSLSISEPVSTTPPKSPFLQEAPGNISEGVTVAAARQPADTSSLLADRSSTVSDHLGATEDKPSGGGILRHEAPLAGTALFRRWATIARETFRRDDTAHRLKNTVKNESTATERGSAVAPSLHCYVFEMRPGTLDGVHFQRQFSSLV
jgi:hypothetical protein